MHLGWVDIDLPIRFCPIPISRGRIGQTVEHSKSMSTQPRCTSTVEQMGHPAAAEDFLESYKYYIA